MEHPIICNRCKNSGICGCRSQHDLPWIIEPSDWDSGDLENLLRHKEGLERDLAKHGGILFRGFGIKTVESFNQLSKCFSSDPIPYMFRSSPRHSISERVYISTTYPQSRCINMHSESSYSFAWGLKIMFGCIHKAAESGETPIADNRKILDHLDPDLIRKFDERGVLYQRNLSPEIGMPWEEVFQTNDPSVVEKLCLENNIRFEFISEENLILRWKKPALYFHPSTGERVWFNHAFFFNRYSLLEEMGLDADDASVDDFLPSETFFGDGTPISYPEYLQIKEAYEKEKVIFEWQEGDVLLLDNMLTAHGRNPYKGDRQVVVSIIEPFHCPNLVWTD
jgi:alpha-ketoglutarate-dependent taurine dioxygenase